MTDIVIIGSGFSACTAVRMLRGSGYRDSITLIAPRADLFYYPSLIWVASGGRKEPDLRINLDNFFRKHNIKHLAASVAELDCRNKTLRTEQGETITYSYLLIASGGWYIQKLPGLEHTHNLCRLGTDKQLGSKTEFHDIRQARVWLRRQSE